MALTDEQTATVITVYLFSLLPTALLLLLYALKRVPQWLFLLWLVSLGLCIFGWELWLTYGLIDGLNVDARRPPALNEAIPMHLNWLLNSLGDASAIGLFGVFLLWLSHGCSNRAFTTWRWSGFAVLFIWFVGQNLWVELYVYQEQLAEGLRLSWAPLIPTGPWFNPTLLEVGGRTVQLQTQWPWILMTPLYYGLLIWLYRRYHTSGDAAA